MCRYALVSGTFFALLTCVQVLRLLRQWPVRVAGVDIPLWASGIAALIAAALTFWAFRTAANARSRPVV
jgi:hypothetical protein